MFRASYRPLSGAYNCTRSLWFCIRFRLKNVALLVVAEQDILPSHDQQRYILQPETYAKLEGAGAGAVAGAGAGAGAGAVAVAGAGAGAGAGAVAGALLVVAGQDMLPGHDQQRYILQPETYSKPETAGAIVCS